MRTAAAAVIAMFALAPGVGAQASGKGFLFHRPVGSFAFRGGYAVANASSDVFDDATTQLTLTKGDFSGVSWGGDISYSTGDRWDLLFDAEVANFSVWRSAPGPGVSDSSLPFEMAVSPRSTVSVTANVALNAGSSKHGNARRASVDSNWVTAYFRSLVLLM